MLSKEEYLKKISLNPRYDIELIGDAFDFGKEMHKNQFRANGEPYFIHCIEVSFILYDLNFDNETIVASLLHDVVEDCDVTIDEIQDRYGDIVANLVNGVTKLNDISNISIKGKAINNYKKLILATTRDIRVILIKIADRIHNMSTIGNLRKEKRIRIANETMKLYVPITAKLGITSWKDKLEDLCFEVLDEESRTLIINRMDTLFHSKYNKLIEEIKQEISLVVSKYVDDFEIIGRVKKPFSIWRKIKEKNISFNRVCDLVAFRIIVNNVDDCYRVMGGVHQNFYVIPKRIKDYISLPKSNGYKSLHTSIMGPMGQRVEVQIKTKEMHCEAEYGVSSHLNYKKFDKYFNEEIFQKYKWVEQYFSLINEFNNTTEIIESNKSEKTVYVFSPKGEIFSLPKKSMPLDFAYLIHTECGEKFAFARINGQIKDISYVLQNGDQVEVINDVNSKPSEQWLEYVVTSKAKNFIKKYIRESKKNDYIDLGKDRFNKYVLLNGLNLVDIDIDKLIQNKNFKDLNDMYMHIGQDGKLIEELIELKKDDDSSKISNDVKIYGMLEKFVDDMVCFCDVCMPIQGDNIFGEYKDNVIKIHGHKCRDLKDIENSIIVDWNKNNDSYNEYKTEINIKFEYLKKSIEDIEQIFKKFNISIYDYKILNFDDLYMEINLIIMVNNVTILDNLLDHLKLYSEIIFASRG